MTIPGVQVVLSSQGRNVFFRPLFKLSPHVKLIYIKYSQYLGIFKQRQAVSIELAFRHIANDSFLKQMDGLDVTCVITAPDWRIVIQ